MRIWNAASTSARPNSKRPTGDWSRSPTQFRTTCARRCGALRFSQALLDDCADKLGEPGKDAKRRVREASQRMEKRSTPCSSCRVLREAVDVSAMALASATEVRKIWLGRQVKLVIAPGLYVEGDRQLLRIMFDNLLGNAWKFTSNGSGRRSGSVRWPPMGRRHISCATTGPGSTWRTAINCSARFNGCMR
jgi:hypothetical protein